MCSSDLAKDLGSAFSDAWNFQKVVAKKAVKDFNVVKGFVEQYDKREDTLLKEVWEDVKEVVKDPKTQKVVKDYFTGSFTVF